MLYIEIELEYMLSFLCIFGVYPIDGVVSASSLSEKGKFTFFTQAASWDNTICRIEPKNA